MLAVQLEVDADVTQPAPLPTGRSFGDWLDELSAGECLWETVIRGVRDALIARPDDGWELLALVDQYFRRHKISAEDFHALNKHVQALIMGAPQPPEPTAPPLDPPAPQTVTDITTATKARSLSVQERLRNRYRIEAVLAHGGMGTVYAATDEFRLGDTEGRQRVALKVLHTEVLKRPQLVAELRAEFQHLQTLSHPNIVRVHEFDRDGDLAFFTMEQLSGAPLSRVLASHRSTPLRRAYARSIIRLVGAAVAYAHSRGIAHGDLNPANIFVTDEGEIRVLDFGSASRLARESVPDIADLSRPAVATPSYSSCELLLGATATASDDIYAMACISYLLLTGLHPYHGRNALQARAARLSPRRPAGLGLRQWRALREGLRFDEEQRPKQMQAWLDRLRLPARVPPLPPLLTVLTPQPPPSSRADWMTGIIIALVAALCWWTINNIDQVRHAAFAAEGHIKGLWQTLHDKAGHATRVPLRATAAPTDRTAPTPHVTAAPAAAPASAAPLPVAEPTDSASASADLPPLARLEMESSTLNADSGSAYVSVVVRRRAAYHSSVSFTWSTQAGTARPNQDFMPVKSRREFIPSGDRETRLLVPVVADSRRHEARSFYVVIDKPGDGARLGARQMTLVTIPPAN